MQKKVLGEVLGGRSARRRLMLLLCAVLVPLAAAGIYNALRVRHERIADAHGEALREARLVHSDIVNIIQGTRNLLTVMAATPAIRDFDRAKCPARLAELHAQFDRYAFFVLTDREGAVTCSSIKPVPPNLTKNQPYMSAAHADGDFVVGNYIRTSGSELSVLPLALPFGGADGRPKGILIAPLDLNWLSRHLAELPDRGNGVISLADRNGVFLARSIDPFRYVGKPMRPDAMWPVNVAVPGTAEVMGIEGIPRIIGFVPATVSPGIYVGVGVDRNEAMRPVDFETGTQAALIVVGVLIALIIGWVGAGKFADLQDRLTTRAAELEAEKQHRSEIEAALVQSQKLEAVGQLTAGLAHDFNNLLAVVLGNIEIARSRLRGDPKTDCLLERSANAAERGTDITRQLLAFARNQPLAVEALDVNHVVERAYDLLEHSVGSRVRIRCDLARDALPILADRGQLEVALLNLVMNARDAIPLAGTITIATRNAPDEARPRDLAPARYVQIRVSDTGSGMTDNVKEKAFEPFFTTKEIGKGSGLGLAQVFGIARQSGGTATIDSKPGVGTSVNIFLPRAAETSKEPHGQGEAVAENNETSPLRLLLADDDSEVRDTVAVMLESCGHTVDQVDSAAAALARLNCDQNYDVLISDLAMPDVNGAQLAGEAVQLAPNLNILLITGFAKGALEYEPPWPLLRKPFKAADLHAAVRGLIPRKNVLTLVRRLENSSTA